MRATLIFVLSAATAMASTFACGGASSPLLDGDDTGGDASTKRDGSTKGDSSTGCVNPIFGESCTTSQSVCGQVGQGNPCCDQAWRCVDGTWQSLAADCACVEPTCGDMNCSSDQYCFVQPPGISFGDGGIADTNYSCLNLPSTCSGATPSCDCIEASNPCSVASCSAADGLITLNCIGE